MPKPKVDMLEPEEKRRFDGNYDKIDWGKKMANPIIIPKTYNYMTAFLTFRCSLKCWYCINDRRSHLLTDRKELSGKVWVEALNRIEPRPDLPITLSGGEPTLHNDFYYIVNHIKPDLKVDLLTNLRFNVEEFVKKVKTNCFSRPAPYASIRVSYHWPWMEVEGLIQKVKYLIKHEFHVGVWGILPPEPERDEQWSKAIVYAKDRCWKEGIDFRTKEFLGWSKGKLYGTYKYPQGLTGVPKKAKCKRSELIIGPDGQIFRCHHDLYAQDPNNYFCGNITYLDPEIKDEFLPCVDYGRCNPCDLKTKFDRFQNPGHCAVEIRGEK